MTDNTSKYSKPLVKKDSKEGFKDSSRGNSAPPK
jgi:hypothetical protein